ncbi:MFS transporter [Dactylosporangium vinaceum]|uniref:MFS transporter n=1 Tax=Dactylosporangium vinaceum TaxID=53362 RepID=A0ABV5M616_9ACTN|nr:MFS transporter [Dactylosporangium vinaceum]
MWKRLRHLRMDVRPLRHRDFRLLMASGLITMFGSFITIVAVPYQIKQLTGSYVAVGAVGVVELVAIVGSGLWGGAIADAVDRRRVVLWCEAAMAVCTGGLLVNAVLPHPVVWPLYVVAGLVATLDGLQRPSLDAMLPRLVPRDEQTAANAMQGIRYQIGAIAGPAVGGVLVTVAGVPAAYGVDVLTFIASVAFLFLLRPIPPAVEAERPSLAGIGRGARYAWSRPELLGTYFVDIAAMFLAMPMALYPFVADALHAQWALGLLYGAMPFGAMLISLTSGWASRVHRHGLAVLVAAGLWGLAIAGFGAAPNIATALVFLVLAGAADMVSGLFRSTIWNQTIPDHLRGRLAGISLLSYSIGPTAGQMRSGVMAAMVGLRPAIVAGGLLCTGAVAACTALMPGFTRYDERTSPHADAATPAATDALEPTAAQ